MNLLLHNVNITHLRKEGETRTYCCHTHIPLESCNTDTDV